MVGFQKQNIVGKTMRLIQGERTNRAEVSHLHAAAAAARGGEFRLEPSQVRVQLVGVSLGVVAGEASVRCVWCLRQHCGHFVSQSAITFTNSEYECA